MNAKKKVVLHAKRASGLFGGTVALLLVAAASTGLLRAFTGGAVNGDRHPCGEVTIAERTFQHSTENVAFNQPAGVPQSPCNTKTPGAEKQTRAPERGFSIVRAAPFAEAALQRKGKKMKDVFPNFANQGRKFNPLGETIGPLATNPTLEVLVIFVKFTTPPPGGPAERLDLGYFDDMLFGTVYDPPEYAIYPGHPTDRTLKNYYEEVSYGQVNVVTLNLPSKVGWGQSDHPYEYYCRADGIHDNGFGPFPGNVLGLVRDAVAAVDPMVDFSQYAIDGEVPNLFVVHAGTGAEWSTDPSIIWSHQAGLSYEPSMPDGYWTDDGVIVDAYAMMPEVGGDLTGYLFGYPLGPYPPTVGVYAHEFGHVLGIPDQYDYGSESDGTGNYSLMAGGPWCFWYRPEPTFPEYLMFMGNSPPHLDPWSKYRLGFVTPVGVEPDAPVSAVLPPVEFSPVVYRMDVPNSGGKEYFLLENRQHVGFDEGLKSMSFPDDPTEVFAASHGLAIWHIDDTVLTRNYWRPNEAQNWKKFRSEGNQKAWTGETHYGISVIQADNEWHLERNNWWGGDTADFFPGTLGVTRFGDDTYPNSSSYWFWPGAEPKFGCSGVTVDNIEETDEGVITADLSFAP